MRDRDPAFPTPAGAILAGVLTFALVVLALAAYGTLAQDACIADADSPVDERWSGSQRLALWPPAALRCEWSSGVDTVSWTMTMWPLWIVYGAVLAAGGLAAWRWATAAR